MGKILLVVLVIVAVYFIVRAYTRAVAAKQQAADTEPRPAEDMVRCAHCGVHLPRAESVAAEGRFFCSTEHRQLHGP